MCTDKVSLIRTKEQHAKAKRVITSGLDKGDVKEEPYKDLGLTQTRGVQETREHQTAPGTDADSDSIADFTL